MKSTIIKPPYPIKFRRKAVFLAGSIEMGAAENWQSKVERLLEDADLEIYNPRRDDWDSSWEQTATNKPFREQVEWELDALERADLVLMYFSPGTMSPISLLELGLYAKSGKLVVCCPEGFWRKGNVDVVCQTYLVNQVDTIEGLAHFAIQLLVDSVAEE
jgi:hypothetical protein